MNSIPFTKFTPHAFNDPAGFPRLDALKDSDYGPNERVEGMFDYPDLPPSG